MIVHVLVHHGFTEIPPGILLKRWTREAKAFGDPKLAAVILAQQATDLDFSGMHTLLYAAAMELVGLASTSRPAFEIGMQTLSRGKQAITSLTVVANAGPVAPAAAADALDADTGADADLGGAAAPPRVRSHGRPAKSRMKSAVESPGAMKGKDTKAGVAVRQSKRLKQILEGDVAAGKCRLCGSSDHFASACPENIVADPKSAAARKCKVCGEEGHYRSTCGRVSTYHGGKGK